MVKLSIRGVPVSNEDLQQDLFTRLFSYRKLNKKHLKFLFSLTLYLSLLSNVSATVQSPCSCLGATEIGRTGHSYDISDLSYSLTAGTCYLIKGTLVIDEDITWDGMRIQMEEKSKIVVEANNRLTLIDSYLSGCDDMWQGIETEASSELLVFNSFIESANIGIRLRDLTIFQCIGSEFIDNYVGVSVSSPFEAIPATPIQIYQKGGITGCKFYTNDVVPDPYPGHYYSSWPTSPANVPFDQGYAAIYVAHSTGLNLGFAHASAAQRNKIYQMRNGVISFESSIDIAGTDFYDFEGTISGSVKYEIPVLEINQHAIHSTQSIHEVKNNTITNIMIGAYSWQSCTTYKGNTLYIKNIDSNLTFTKGIYSKESQLFIADDNIINDGFKGISLLNMSNTMSITDNTFNRTISYGNHAGIEIINARFSPDGIIKDNYMEINNASNATGLSLNQISFLSVNNNDFYFDEDSGSAGDYNCGIMGLSCDWNYYRRNDIWADANYIDESGNHGMVFTNSVNNVYFCNTIDSMYSLLRFIGACSNTNLIATQLKRGRIAFELSAPAAIGLQDQNGNEWLHSYSVEGALISGEDVVGTAEASIFHYDDTDNGAERQLPHTIGPPAVDNGIWFHWDVDGVGKTCEVEDPDIAPDPDSLAVRILDLPQFDTLNDQMTWMMKAKFFKLMLLDTSLADNSILDSFFDAEAVKPLGKLVTAHFDLDSRYGIDFKVKTNTQDSILLLSEDIAYIDSLLALSPNDSATWISLRVLKVDTLSDRLDSWIDFLDDESSESNDVYEDVIDSLAAISTTNDMEEYYQDALLFKADFLVGNTISASDSSDIADIAQLCPWEGGPAMSVAQGLLTILTDSTTNVEPYDCPAPPSPYISYPDSGQQLYEGHFFTFYPNPARDIVKIRSDMTINSAELRDASNRVLGSFHPNSKQLSIDVSNLPSGIYFISSKSGDYMETQRIIVIK
jgi:hypothetical protein